MIPQQKTPPTATLSSQDMFILTAEGPTPKEMSSGNIENAVNDNHWVDNLYEESSDHFKSYLEKIARIKLLSREEEAKLAGLIKQGDEKALEKMVHYNLRLVVWAAMKFRGRLYASHGMELMDLIQEGNLGLVMKAVKRFDPSFGCKFSTYAFWWIRQFIHRSLDEKGRTIDLPVNISEKLRAFDKAVQRLNVMLLREPSINEIAQETNLQSDQVLVFQKILRQTSMARIKNQYDDDGKENRSYYFQIPSQEKSPDEILHEKELKRSLNVVLKTALNIKEYEIFVMRHGLNGSAKLTLEKIGEKYGVTRERIRQIEAKAFDKLKSNLKFIQLAFTNGIKVSKEIHEEAKAKAFPTLTWSIPPTDYKSETYKASVKEMVKKVSDFYGIEESSLRGFSRKLNFVKPRHVAMYLLNKDCKVPLVKIALELGERDHTTVLHACRKIEKDLKESQTLFNEVKSIRKMFEKSKLEIPKSISHLLSEEEVLEPIQKYEPPPALTSNPAPRNFASPLEIIRRIAKFYGVKEHFVYNGVEDAEVLKVRHVVSYIFKDMFKLPTEDIGRKLGGRTDDTIMAWYDEIKNCIQSDEKTAGEIAHIKASLCYV